MPARFLAGEEVNNLIRARNRGYHRSAGQGRRSRREIERLTNLIAHRGPDGAPDYWFKCAADTHIALGHRRLAIIDPGPGGHQPMLSGDGRHVIVYNGEIYNFLELRRELEALGAKFRSQSDTEVILAAWREWQEGMLSRFNGMWALAIFDTETRELFLARDRFGIKPLLYAMSPQRLVFASEQRALVRSGLITPSVDIEVARRLMLDAFGVEGSERTLCRDVRRLQGGHCMWLRGGRLDQSVTRWWPYRRSSAGGAGYRTSGGSSASENCSAMRSRCECAATCRSEPAFPAVSIHPP